MTTAIKTASELPELPAPAGLKYEGLGRVSCVPGAGYTPGQMRDYARAALAAGRAEPEVPNTFKAPGEADDAWIDRITGAAPSQPVGSALTEALRALSHELDDEAQGITDRTAYDFATRIRVLIGIDGEEAALAALTPSQPAGSALLAEFLSEAKKAGVTHLDIAAPPVGSALTDARIWELWREAENVHTVEVDMSFARMIEREVLAALTPEPAALPAQPAAADGWKLVPVEPTQEMVTAYLQANDAYWKRTDELPSKNASRWREGKPNEATAESYKAMLAAAPAQPAPEGDWLWIKLMDFCKARGFHPGQFNDLFAIVTEARQAKAQAAAVPEAVERCECGYPMPCSKTVPINFCKAGLAAPEAGARD